MFTHYEPRPLAFLGIESVAGYRLKAYAIHYGDRPFDRNRFAGAWLQAISELPQPAIAVDRPGVGFVVMHQGRTGDYFILAWWDRENELPLRVFVADAGEWRPVRGGESACVWDLRVIWSEREAYVGTVLAGRTDGVEAYLTATNEGYA
jgi:hypothetical protein